jgi:hypothetical protein
MHEQRPPPYSADIVAQESPPYTMSDYPAVTLLLISASIAAFGCILCNERT